MESERDSSEEREASPLFEPEQNSRTLTGASTILAQQAASKKRKAEAMVGSDNDDSESESEDEDGNDGEDIVLPHDPNTEPLPDLPIYHPAVKKVLKLAYLLVEPFREYLTNCSLKDRETEYLLDLTKQLEHPPNETEVIRIGLVGDAGQGKSSLLNSILGHENLAIHGDDGDSCTSVVMEFAQAPPNQTTPFRAVIEFYSIQSCTELIKEQLANYFKYMSKTEESEEEEVHDLRLASLTAVTIFTALFMDRPECADKGQTEEFLETMSSADDSQILGKLINWTHFILNELMPGAGADTYTATFSASTSNLLSELIAPFMMTVPCPSFQGTNVRCCPWPIVKNVRVTFNSSVLNQGIILVDLPGISDKIRSRVDSTKRYLQSCDISIVVNNIGRSIDHKSFSNQIVNAFKRRRSGSIIVVCTRSDDLPAKGKQSFPYTPAEEKALVEITDEEFKVTKKIQDLNTALSAIKGRKQPFEKFKLSQKKNAMLLKKHAIGLKRFEVRVQARNRHVKSGIAEGYRLDTKDRAPLPIFCVSNTMHAQHLAGYYKKSPPDLSLRATEIPQLREAIFSLPSTGRFLSLEHHCKFRLPELLNTIEISCSVSKLKRKKMLTETFEKSRASIRQTVEDRADIFRVNEFDPVHSTIVKHELRWTVKARKRCEIWSKLPPASHRSVMRHEGEWTTKKISSQHWNSDLLIAVAMDIDGVFEMIHNVVCEQVTTDISERVGEAITKLSTTLDSEPAASLSGALKAFNDNLKQRRADIEQICRNFGQTLKREVRKIHVRATTDGPDHYFTHAMKPVYVAADKAPKPKGGTLHQARCAKFTSLVCTVGEESVFLQISQGIRDDFDKMFGELVENFIELLDRVFKRTQHDVDLVCSTKEDDSPEAREVREELLGMLPGARDALKEEIWVYLDACKGGKN